MKTNEVSQVILIQKIKMKVASFDPCYLGDIRRNQTEVEWGRGDRGEDKHREREVPLGRHAWFCVILRGGQHGRSRPDVPVLSQVLQTGRTLFNMALMYMPCINYIFKTLIMIFMSKVLTVQRDSVVCIRKKLIWSIVVYDLNSFIKHKSILLWELFFSSSLT